MASLALPKGLRAAHHTEDGVHNDIDKDGGGLPPVPHGPHRFLVVGQEVIRQPEQSGQGGVAGLGGRPLAGWEGEQFNTGARALALPPQLRICSKISSSGRVKWLSK